MSLVRTSTSDSRISSCRCSCFTMRENLAIPSWEESLACHGEFRHLCVSTRSERVEIRLPSNPCEIHVRICACDFRHHESSGTNTRIYFALTFAVSLYFLHCFCITCSSSTRKSKLPLYHEPQIYLLRRCYRRHSLGSTTACLKYLSTEINPFRTLSHLAVCSHHVDSSY